MMIGTRRVACSRRAIEMPSLIWQIDVEYDEVRRSLGIERPVELGPAGALLT